MSKFVNFESPIQIKNYLYTVVFTTARVKGQDPRILDLYNLRVKNNGPVTAHLSTLQQSQVNNTVLNNNLSSILNQSSPAEELDKTTSRFREVMQHYDQSLSTIEKGRFVDIIQKNNLETVLPHIQRAG